MSLQVRVAAEIERRRRIASGEAGPTYRQFQETYRDDPARFIWDCIDLRSGATAYQLETAKALVDSQRVTVRGPHGLGKTALAAWVILWFALTRDGAVDWKIPTTASAWRQLSKYLWPEVRKWSRRLHWEKIGRAPFNNNELLTLSLKLDTGEAFALASGDAASIEGAHAESLLYVFDEAKTIPPDIWDGAEGAFASPEIGEALAFAVSTPGAPIGRFYDIHARTPGYEDWQAIHVTLEQAIDAGRISREWAEQRAKQWGEQSAVYQNRVLGEFAIGAEDTVISLAWVEAANERWHEGEPCRIERVGVDVARYGEDQTVLALGNNRRVNDLRYYAKYDTMRTTGRVAGILTANESARGVIDVVGIGAGVFDRLREQGFNVQAFSAGERTDWRDKSGELGFVDKRSAGWWMLREMLEAGEVALPPDDILTGDLVAPKWREMSGGRIKVESKDEIRKRLRRSTDAADAVIMQLWNSGTWWAL